MEEVSSPSPAVGMRPLDCVEDLVRFTLSYLLDGTLGADIGLPTDYCLRLLQEETSVANHPYSDLPTNGEIVADHLRGVPVYPLYKRLGLALERCFRHGSFLRTSESINGIEEIDRHDKSSEWNDLIKHSELRRLCRLVVLDMDVQEPFFSQLRAGEKTVEGRCALGKYNQIKAGDFLLVNKHLLLRVERVNHYPLFFKMLEEETLDNVLPGVKTMEEGVKIYRKFYSEEKEQSNGVVGICISRPDFQPCTAMGAVLFGLGYEGIACLLGMAQTVGTVLDALPPPRSDLLSSFSLCHEPDVKGCKLTEGARALSKHMGRCSSGWWGSLTGSDTQKNDTSVSIVNRLLNNSCWMNSHVTKALDCIFEIRVEEGYGARWSMDGTKAFWSLTWRMATPGDGVTKLFCNFGAMRRNRCLRYSSHYDDYCHQVLVGGG